MQCTRRHTMEQAAVLLGPHALPHLLEPLDLLHVRNPIDLGVWTHISNTSDCGGVSLNTAVILTGHLPYDQRAQERFAYDNQSCHQRCGSLVSWVT